MKLPKQAKIVMKTFGKGKLRSKSGDTVTNPEQAFAIGMSEVRTAQKRGASKRTWRGRTRIRPKLKYQSRTPVETHKSQWF